ncbi:hypothetical protein [Rubrivirga sp.]|uniref:hypothetical protein n=1 Tax=Rubrivirga sp. TaxID=1885344 RepID=UPI003B51AF86
MNLHARLKKLEGTRPTGYVVDSAEDREAVGVLLNCAVICGLDPGDWRGPDPTRPPGPSYSTLLAEGRVTETDDYVASLWEAEEERAASRLDAEVESWRSALPHSPRRAFYRANWLRGLVAEPVPEDYGRHRPSFDRPFALADRPSLVTVAKRHGGAHEAATWADDFEREHPEDAAYILSRTDRHPRP